MTTRDVAVRWAALCGERDWGVVDIIEQAIVEEREECAKLADELAKNAGFEGWPYAYTAKQIRARLIRF